MFSTHLHMLLDDFKNEPGVATYHMAFKEGGAADRITFLYKFIRGECPQSFGLNVARLAGIPACILEKAKVKSEEFTARVEERTRQMR
mmetsp:Transcript_21387/g.33084  ORF Transcript_21387/g.33084 Transcript_21387/m.33084 type:complete len:88 (+) Transcript_21387:3255-3518(+)